MKRAGFTMIELLVVITVLGLLAGIAIFKYIDLTRDALAAKIASDFSTIRLAAYTYEADHQNLWPAETGPGVLPPELAPYLPGSIDFNEPTFSYDWENNMSSGGPFLLGITCRTSDTRLITKLTQRLGTTAPFYAVGSTLTLVIIDNTGNY